MKKAALHNLGCKVNAYELDVVQQILQENGFTIVPFDQKADIYIVNTCTVTNIADRKSRQMLHRARMQNPRAVVAAIGCYVQTDLEKVEQDECVDLAIGNNRKKDIAAILEGYLRERGLWQEGDKSPEGVPAYETVVDVNHTAEYEEMTLKRTAGHTRAYIKVQDGCNQFCAYCIIPYARGRVRSRRMSDILTEVEGLAVAGYREIVLTGIHISSYGIDFDDAAWQQGESVELMLREDRRAYDGGPKLIGLVERLQQIPGLERIRLGSLEPRIVTEEFADRLSRLDKVCPHFHLSLQSGCDAVLKRMNRRYTAGEYYRCVEILRRFFDTPAVTTDVIVGFPGETEEEFRETVRFLEKVQFYEMHIFKYSRRRGTPADKMPGQLTEAEKGRRSGILLELEKRQSREFRSRYIGREADVLFEDSREIGGHTYQIGHTKDYVKVAVETQECLSNRVKKVFIHDFLTEEILF